MSDIIERAARALSGWTPNMTSWDGMVDDPKESLAIREHFRQMVRVVLQAIREPSEEMIEAGNIADRGMLPWKGQWQAMIDTLLDEQP